MRVLREDRKADKGLQSTVFLTTLSLLPLRIERRGSRLARCSLSAFRRPHRCTHAAAAEGKRAAAAMLTAKDWKQPSPLPWSWEEFASSLYTATSNFLTQNTKLPKPDSAASGDMAESHLAQTGLESKPRVLGFYRDTLPRSTVTRDKLAFPI